MTQPATSVPSVDTELIAQGGQLGFNATRDAINAIVLTLQALSAQIAKRIGSWGDVAYASGNFTSDQTWTVGSGDQSRYRALLLDNLLVLDVELLTTTTAAAPTELRIALPSGLLVDGSGTQRVGTAQWKTSATQELAGVHAAAGAAYVSVQRDDPTGGAFPNVSDDLQVGFTVLVAVQPRG